MWAKRSSVRPELFDSATFMSLTIFYFALKVSFCYNHKDNMFAQIDQSINHVSCKKSSPVTYENLSLNLK